MFDMKSECERQPEGGGAAGGDKKRSWVSECERQPEGGGAAGGDKKRSWTVEGECTGQFSRAVTKAELVLMDKAITEYRFDQVRYRLVTQELLRPEEIEVAIEEFKKFLMVIAHTDGPVSMISPKVDEVWHAFILHTSDYVSFTQDVFGTYLHHQPNTPATPSDSGGVDNFLRVYYDLFGELNQIWFSTENQH